MKLLHKCLTGALLFSGVSSVVMADSSLTPNQIKEIQGVVRSYLISNPEVLIEAYQALQQKQQLAMQSQAKSAIQKNADKLFNDKFTVIGNPKGNVTLVEFFDYQCGHCKKMVPVVNELIKRNPNLRVILKELPIFGESSESASKVALAAGLQGKYQIFHDKLIQIQQKLDDKTILDTAKSAGLNMKQLESDKSGQAVSDLLKENMLLAEELHLMGTPAFIVVSTPEGKYVQGTEATFIPGAASLESLQTLINQAAGKKS